MAGHGRMASLLCSGPLRFEANHGSGHVISLFPGLTTKMELRPKPAYRPPPERIALPQGTPQIAFLDALNLRVRQRHCDSLEAHRRGGTGYLVVTFDRPHPSANTTPAATSSALCV